MVKAVTIILYGDGGDIGDDGVGRNDGALDNTPQEMLGAGAAVVEVELADGRMEEEGDTMDGGPATTTTTLSLDKVEEDNQLVMVRLSSQHYAFSLSRSTVTRWEGSTARWHCRIGWRHQQ